MKKHTLKFPGINRALFVWIALFTFHFSIAQSPLSVLENRLSKTWKLESTVQGDKSTVADKSLSDFVMILSGDHIAKQGMNPDGLIGGKWSVDEKTMMLTI